MLGQQAPNAALLLGVALAGTVVAEATPIGQVEKVALTFTLPVPDGGTATWNGTVRVSPGLVLVLAVSVPLTSSRPVALTIVTLMLKRQTYELFCWCGQGPLVTWMLATANAAGSAEVDGARAGVDGAWLVAPAPSGMLPGVVAPGLTAGEPGGAGDRDAPDAGTAPVRCPDTRGPRWSVRTARDGWDGRNT